MSRGRGIAGRDTRHSSLFAIIRSDKVGRKTIHLEHGFHPGQVFVVRVYNVVIIFRVAWYAVLVTQNSVLKNAKGGSRKVVLYIG
jgi:hypothetical protein